MRLLYVRNLFAGFLLSFAASAFAANQAPVVSSINSPPDGILIGLTESVTFTATASDADGTVTKVEYFNGSTSIGFASSAPWTKVWTPAAAGTFTITAKATDAENKTGSASPGIQVRVVNVTTTIGTPAANSTIPAGAVSVTGTIQNPLGTETIIVTAGGGHSVVASLSGGNYSAVVPVAVGANRIEVQVARRNGTAEVKWINVTGAPTPVVALTQPTSCGPYAPGSSITVAADAAVETGSISSVQFYDNGVAFGSPITSPPYTISRTLTVGTHSFTATATAGSITSPHSAPAVVNCASTNTPPTVTLTSPVNNAVFTAPATINFAATATDANGTVDKVQFYGGGSVRDTDFTSPYQGVWSGVPAGTYQVKAVATDNDQATGESATIQIVVNPPPANQPPTVSITAPANGATLTAPASTNITSSANDPDGSVVSVMYFVNGTVLGVSTTGPAFSVPWNNVMPGVYRLTAIATDNANLAGSPSAEVIVNVAVATEPGETIVFLHNDFAGNTIAATDGTGAILWKESYRPFGDRINRDPAAGANRQWFGEKAEDAETGLSYFGARYYDSVTGRFVSPDPRGFEAANSHTFNRFAYANNNPYRYVDPDGRMAVPFLAPPAGAMAPPPSVPTANPNTFSGTKSEVQQLQALEISGAPSLPNFRLPTFEPADVVNLILGGFPAVVAGRLSNLIFSEGKEGTQISRPPGVPDTWVQEAGKSDGHTKWVNPENPRHDYVRLKPDGTVTQVRNGKAFDVDGNQVELRSPAAHGITIDKFTFRP